MFDFSLNLELLSHSWGLCCAPGTRCVCLRFHLLACNLHVPKELKTSESGFCLGVNQCNPEITGQRQRMTLRHLQSGGIWFACHAQILLVEAGGSARSSEAVDVLCRLQRGEQGGLDAAPWGSVPSHRTESGCYGVLPVCALV